MDLAAKIEAQQRMLLNVVRLLDEKAILSLRDVADCWHQSAQRLDGPVASIIRGMANGVLDVLGDPPSLQVIEGGKDKPEEG
jgi:hypothetical protein